MSYEARDIQVNSAGRFVFSAGVENVGQKVEKFFVPILAQFVGQKTAVPLGAALGSVRLIEFIKDLYLQTQARAINIELYDNDDTVEDIDSIKVVQVNPTTVEFSFRVVLPDSSVLIRGTLPVGATGIIGA
jgi:hypothetical protein